MKLLIGALVATTTLAHADDAFPVAPIPKLAVDAETFIDGDYVRRAGADLNEVRLDRGEAGATVGLGRYVASELRLEAVRSAAEGGALGIDGNSLVARIKRVQVTATYDASDLVRLDGAVGLAADPWIAALEDGNPTRPLSRTASERLLGYSASDLAFVGRITVGPVRATVAIGNGEGLQYPERNTGKTTSAIVEVVPLATAAARLRIAALARDGSIGPASIRDHRFGGMATLATPYGDAGVEVVHALGLAGDATLTGTVYGGWLEARPIDHAVLAARGATLRLGSGARSTFGGAIAVEPWRTGARDRVRVWLAIDRSTSSGSAMPLVSDPGTATTIMVIVSATRSFAIAQD